MRDAAGSAAAAGSRSGEPGNLAPMSLAMAPVDISFARAIPSGVIFVSSVTNVSSARYRPRQTYALLLLDAPDAPAVSGLTVARAGSPSATTRLVNMAYAPSAVLKRERLTSTLFGPPDPSTYRSTTTRSRSKRLYTSQSPSNAVVHTSSIESLPCSPYVFGSPWGSMQ